jgi:membrane protease YdiL (CAAX protease family)
MAGGVVVLLGSVFAEGELGAFLFGAWQTVPVVMMCAVAYLGLDRRWARWLAIFLFTGLVVTAAIFSAAMVIIARMDAYGDGLPFGGEPHPEVFLGLAAVAFAALASLAAIPVVRARLPGNLEFVHRLAIVTTIALGGIAVAPLLVLGEPPLLVWLDAMVEAEVDPNAGRGDTGMLLDSFYALCWIVPGAVFAVGYGIRRDLRGALARLGLVRPSRRQYILAAVMTVVLVGFSWVFDEAVSEIWAWTGWPVTDEDALEHLFSFAFSVSGAIVIGVTAGLGEEIAVRGILQPRVGLLLSNVLFTALHAYQYNWDGLLSVFVMGLIFGLLRRRTNTTVSAIVHGGYDFILLMIMAMSMP